MIQVKNIDPKSSLHFDTLEWKGSAGSDTITINAGIVAYACRLEDILIGCSASALSQTLEIDVNNVSYATVLVSSISVSGGVIRVKGPSSPRLITAGSLIQVGTSSTATNAEFLYKMRFKLAEHVGK